MKLSVSRRVSSWYGALRSKISHVNTLAPIANHPHTRLKIFKCESGCFAHAAMMHKHISGSYFWYIYTCSLSATDSIERKGHTVVIIARDLFTKSAPRDLGRIVIAPRGLVHTQTCLSLKYIITVVGRTHHEPSLYFNQSPLYIYKGAESDVFVCLLLVNRVRIHQHMCCTCRANDKHSCANRIARQND